MQFMSKTNYAINVNLNYKTNRINNVYYTNLFRFDVGQYTI